MSDAAESTTAPAGAEESSAAEESRTAKDPDRWDDDEPVEEPEAKDPGDEQPEEDGDKKAAAKKKPSKEEKAQEEKKQAEQRERRLRKMMIDGKEELVDEEEAIRAYAKNRAADKRLEEAAMVRKQLEAFKEQFTADPLAVLNNPNLPINKRELAQRWLKESIAEELKDPTELELEQARAKLKAYEDNERAIKEQAEKAEMQKKAHARREEMAKVFGEAMQASVLSKDPEIAAATLRNMAMYARLAKQADPDAPLPSPEELATHVENQSLKGFHSVAKTLSGDQLIQFMGEDIVNRIRKADLERIKKQRGIPDHKEERQPDSWARSKEQGSKERKFIDPVSMREITRKRLGL